MNAASLIIIAAVAVLFVLALRYAMKHGGSCGECSSGCSGNCSGCSASCAPPSGHTDAEKNLHAMMEDLKTKGSK